MDNNPQNMASQFRPAVPVQPSQSYIQSASGAQQYRPMGQPQMTQSSQPMQQTPGQPGHLSSSSQPPTFYMQPPQSHNSAYTNSYLPGLGGPLYTALWPPLIGSIGSQSFGINYSMQFWPVVPVQPSQSYIQSASGAQQYRPMGQPQMTQSSQPMQQTPGQSGHLSSSSQPPTFYMQPPQSQNSVYTNSYLPGLGGPSYTPWMSSGNQDPLNVALVPQTGQQPSSASQDSQEYTTDGRRYYYNKETMQTSWEKPLELMTRQERAVADASTVWKEYTTEKGTKYYYNKDKKQSRWTMPDELKLAYEQAKKEDSRGTQSLSLTPVAVTPVSTNMHSSRMSKLDNSSLLGISKALDRVLTQEAEVEAKYREKERQVISIYRQSLKERGYYWHQQTGPQPSTITPSSASQDGAADWREITANDGRRYYYDKKIKQTSWKKPLELMTPLKLACEHAEKEASIGTQSPATLTPSTLDQLPASVSSAIPASVSTFQIEKKHIKRVERKNCDEFRKLMNEHIISGMLNAKTQWCDYCQEVKASVAYQAVASNTSGSTPRDLFEDVVEELDKKYHEVKTRVEDALNLKKVSVLPTWRLEDFKAAVEEDIISSLSDINIQLVFEDLVERAKEKAEKEVKNLQQLAKDCSELLYDIKEITETLTREEFQQLFEESSESRAISDEITARKDFMTCFARLLEKVKEKERKWDEEKARKEEKEKWKEKKGREKDKDREERDKSKDKERLKKDDSDSEHLDAAVEHKVDKRRDMKHWKRHRDDASSDKDEKDDSRKSHRHGSDPKKSRKLTACIYT